MQNIYSCSSNSNISDLNNSQKYTNDDNNFNLRTNPKNEEIKNINQQGNLPQLDELLQTPEFQKQENNQNNQNNFNNQDIDNVQKNQLNKNPIPNNNINQYYGPDSEFWKYGFFGPHGISGFQNYYPHHIPHGHHHFWGGPHFPHGWQNFPTENEKKGLNKEINPNPDDKQEYNYEENSPHGPNFWHGPHGPPHFLHGPHFHHGHRPHFPHDPNSPHGPQKEGNFDSPHGPHEPDWHHHGPHFHHGFFHGPHGPPLHEYPHGPHGHFGHHGFYGHHGPHGPSPGPQESNNNH